MVGQENIVQIENALVFGLKLFDGLATKKHVFQNALYVAKSLKKEQQHTVQKNQHAHNLVM